jgi:hypothetical protein
MAQVDTSIYGRIEPVRMVDPMVRAQNALTLENARQANRMNALKFDEMERARAEAAADQETLRAYFQAGGGEGNLNALNVRPGLRMAEEKRLLEAAKQREEAAAKRATTGKTTQETLDARLKTYRTALDFIDTPQAAARWTEAQFNDPVVSEFVRRNGSLEEIVGRIPSDPQQFQQWRQQSAMGMQKFIENQTTQRGQNITMRGQDLTDVRTRSEGAANRAVTLRGQDLTDARAREGLAAGRAGDTKPPTEGQAKSVLFGSRMVAADKVIKEMGEKGVNMPSVYKQGMEAVPFIGGVLGTAANLVQSPEQQQVEQAQRDFINAVLRRESGAVIADSEFDNARKQYFPQIGDSEAVIRQKAKTRTTAIEGLKVEAGPHWRDVSGATQGTQPMPRQPIQRPPVNVPQSVEDLLKKYGQ